MSLSSPEVSPRERSSVLYAALVFKKYSPLPLIGRFSKTDECEVFELDRDRENTITLTCVFKYQQGELSVKSGEVLTVDRVFNPEDGWLVFLDEEGNEYLPLDRTNSPLG